MQRTGVSKNNIYVDREKGAFGRGKELCECREQVRYWRKDWEVKGERVNGTVYSDENGMHR